jgi:hypothetical protein
METKNEIYQKCYLDKIIMEKNDTFECLVIKPGTIKSIPWTLPDYAERLMELDLFESIKTNPNNFIEILSVNLDVDKYKISNLSVKTEIFAEEPYYLYELMYVDLEKATEYHSDENLNELASLLNTNGDKIYSNAIVFKNYIPSLTDSMNLCTVTKKDLGQVLHNRVYTKIVLFDNNEWFEDIAHGDLNNYANNFFDNEGFRKLEIPFLMHNINIWYTVTNYGKSNICGNLIKNKIDKCIWFSMKSEEYRGNITLDEVKKIISLSNVLSDFTTPSELLTEKTDNLGRKIINNKFKVLDWTFNKYITESN